MKIQNKTYNIKSNINKKIVLISDIHYSSKKDIKNLNIVLDRIKKINPDYICIPGDTIDKSEIKDSVQFINWLKKLTKISKVIVSIGNHEFYITKNKFGLNRDFLRKISYIDNLYLLNNQNIVIDNINFIGITAPIECYNNKEGIKQYLKNIKTDSKYYNILLCHSPEFVYCEDNIKDLSLDLVLCGHMHGGLVPPMFRFIFKNNGLVSPYKKLFPKNVYGHLKVNNTDIIITSGLRVFPLRPINSLFTKEIVIINLTFDKKYV